MLREMQISEIKNLTYVKGKLISDFNDKDLRLISDPDEIKQQPIIKLEVMTAYADSCYIVSKEINSTYNLDE